MKSKQKSIEANKQKKKRKQDYEDLYNKVMMNFT